MTTQSSRKNGLARFLCILAVDFTAFLMILVIFSTIESELGSMFLLALSVVNFFLMFLASKLDQNAAMGIFAVVGSILFYLSIGGQII